jgi:hypothetical protein
VRDDPVGVAFCPEGTVSSGAGAPCRGPRPGAASTQRKVDGLLLSSRERRWLSVVPKWRGSAAPPWASSRTSWSSRCESLVSS